MQDRRHNFGAAVFSAFVSSLVDTETSHGHLFELARPVRTAYAAGLANQDSERLRNFAV